MKRTSVWVLALCGLLSLPACKSTCDKMAPALKKCIKTLDGKDEESIAENCEAKQDSEEIKTWVECFEKAGDDCDALNECVFEKVAARAGVKPSGDGDSAKTSGGFDALAAHRSRMAYSKCQSEKCDDPPKATFFKKTGVKIFVAEGLSATEAGDTVTITASGFPTVTIAKRKGTVKETGRVPDATKTVPDNEKFVTAGLAHYWECRSENMNGAGKEPFSTCLDLEILSNPAAILKCTASDGGDQAKLDAAAKGKQALALDCYTKMLARGHGTDSSRRPVVSLTRGLGKKGGSTSVTSGGGGGASLDAKATKCIEDIPGSIIRSEGLPDGTYECKLEIHRY